MISEYVSSKRGDMLHHRSCRYAGEGDGKLPNRLMLDDEDLFLYAVRVGLKLCKVCDPLEASKRQLWYDVDGKPITLAQAVTLLNDVAGRHVKTTHLQYVGDELQVVTYFIPVDHGETHGRYTKTPATWCTEIVGGGESLDGTQRYLTSRDLALVAHEQMVEFAETAGCIRVE